MKIKLLSKEEKMTLIIVLASILILALASGCTPMKLPLDANGNPVNYICPEGYFKMPVISPPMQPICTNEAGSDFVKGLIRLP